MITVSRGGFLDEHIAYVTVTHIRKYRGRHPKYMNMGGMSRGASYQYIGEGKNQIEVSKIELSWLAN